MQTAADHRDDRATQREDGVSVVVCTRNRGERIGGTVETILASTWPCFELIVIDQSSDDATARALGAWAGDPRLRYLPTATRGLSVARNIGLAEARHEIVLMTDDDCDVPADWIAQMAAVFARHPQVACVFCDVSAGPHDSALGFVPYNIHSAERMVERLREYMPGEGIGAGMALRRSAALQAGGFDRQLGAGVALASGEEVDLTLRLLLGGYQVYHTKSASVVHHGFRTHAEGRQLIRGYMYGSSALYAKLIRCGHWAVLPLYLAVIRISVLDLVIESLRQGRPPPVLRRIAYLGRGFLRGLQMPVDRDRALFLPIKGG